MVKKKIQKKEIKKILNKKEIQNKQIMWAVILSISVILIIIFVPLITKNFVNKFVYIKLDFQKTKLGEIIFYSTSVPVTAGDKIIGGYTMNFRNDPRELENVEIDIPQNLIGFKKQNIVYITLNPGMEPCEDHTIALMNLAVFLKDFTNLNVSSGISDKEEAEINNIPYVTCENHPNNTVLEITSGEKTLIKKIDENCYLMMYNNCEITQVTEKFMLAILEPYMNYFTKKDASFLDMFR